eukprot:CAMPEP_0114249538 /NCGR_PEP_ID=MMETSP0058-20121206/14195_1 /TAXON_ID=36894 /ORGANISM="Pyramimonas parkeae, CCMP726" /LENGTH=82 /DNA_ID=CAMNT_0001363089 /DNA_START=155 /DNA_END=400 /DNA_ORIENTATION=+
MAKTAIISLNIRLEHASMYAYHHSNPANFSSRSPMAACMSTSNSVDVHTVEKRRSISTTMLHTEALQMFANAPHTSTASGCW